jgi:hypothetical protein
MTKTEYSTYWLGGDHDGRECILFLEVQECSGEFEVTGGVWKDDGTEMDDDLIFEDDSFLDRVTEDWTSEWISAHEPEFMTFTGRTAFGGTYAYRVDMSDSPY